MSKQNYEASQTNHTPDRYQTNADFVYSSKYTSPVLGLLDAKPGERIIDLGCGTGELTEIIKTAVGPQGSVWGVDSSESMVENAKSKSTSEGIKYLKGDIQVLKDSVDPSLAGSFDAVFSSAAFHWCKADPGGVIDSVRWLLKPGGRLAFEMGGFGNCVGVRAAIHEVLRRRGVDPIPLDPWYFPNVAQYATLIADHGMTSSGLELVPRPTPLTTDLHGWLKTFVENTFFVSYSEQEAEQLIKEIEDICRPDAYWSLENPGMGLKQENEDQSLSPHGWEIMYVRLRGVAHRLAEAKV